MENYYELLSVSPSASKEELEKAIFQQQRLWHSRVNSADFERRVKAERMLRKLEEIQDVLLDDEKREEYNRSLFSLSISSFRSEAEESNETTKTVPEEKEKEAVKLIEPSGGSETAQEETKETEDLETPHKITKDPEKEDLKEATPSEAEKPEDQQKDTMSPDEMYRLGKRMIDENESETELNKGIEWMIQAAEGGSIYAMYQLALYFFEGAVLPSDPEEGEKWLVQAAEAGYIPAMVELGRRLLEGDQLERDSARGIEWVGKAADLGNEKANAILSEWMYQLGMHFLGTTSNKEKGAEWLRKAAEAGHVLAMLELGRRLVDGDQMEKNTTEGISWLVKAAKNGSSEAQQILDERRSREQTRQTTDPTTHIFQPSPPSYSSPKKEESTFFHQQSTTNAPQTQIAKKNGISAWIRTILTIVAVFVGIYVISDYWMQTGNTIPLPPSETPTTPEQNETDDEEPIENVDEPKKEEQVEQNRQWVPPRNTTDHNSNYQQPNNGMTNPNEEETTNPDQGRDDDPNQGGDDDPGHGGGGGDSGSGGDGGGGGDNPGTGDGGTPNPGSGSGSPTPPTNNGESD